MTPAEKLGAQWWDAMLIGDFEHARSASDRIRDLGEVNPHQFWHGEDYAGKRVMLRCLHGFGDALQFLRYVPRLKERAASVCVEVAPRLVELARRLEGIDDVITWGKDAPTCPPHWDVQMEVMELPYVFRTKFAELPGAAKYLHVRPTDKACAGLLRVGLAWRAGDWNPSREVPLALLQPLLQVNGCEFWNLTQNSSEIGMCEDAACRESLLGLAQRIASLDLVITVDTLAAHLAGAVGVPTWLMLNESCDWRWMRDREDSPWYPSARIFRQKDGGGWNPVVQRLAQTLKERTSE